MPKWFESALKIGFSCSYLLMCLSKFSSSSSNLYFSSSFTKLVMVSSLWLIFSLIIFEEDLLDWSWLIKETWLWLWSFFWCFWWLPRPGCTKGLWLYRFDVTEDFDGDSSGYSFGNGDKLTSCHFCKVFIRICHIFVFDFEMNDNCNAWTQSTEWTVLVIWTNNGSHNVLANDSHS